MPAGEIQIVARGQENIFLSADPQITFFKIVYRRYTNFSIETVKTDFLYPVKFGKTFTCELSKIGDLLNNIWIIIELPDIPLIYNFDNEIDEKIKFKWARKIAYALIDYVDIDIGGKIIDRQWGEWMNVLNELNFNNFQYRLDEYIGNTPEFITYSYVKNNIKSKCLHIPIFFWFCKSSGLALPILCLEYNLIKFTITLNDFKNCGIFSPSNYIPIQKYYGQGILGEPLLQISNQGYAWGEFDSIDINTHNTTTLHVTSYNLYYRKISDNSFITTTEEYLNNLINIENINELLEIFNNKTKYIIYGLTSGSIYIPIYANKYDHKSIFIERNYMYPDDNLLLKNCYLLCDYIYLDRDERKKFYNNKHTYIIEQIYFSNNMYLDNLNNKNNIEIINPCKYFIFMGQVKYFTNPNVNELFNYNTLFFNENINLLNNKIIKKSVIKNAFFSLNSNKMIDNLEMNYYKLYNPYNYFIMSNIPSGFGLESFSLYPQNIQPSGSCNLSCLNTVEINTQFNNIDVDYNNYIFKTYAITYNVLKIVNGVCGTLFNSNQ